MRLRAEDLVTFGYLAVLTLLVVLHRERIPSWPLYPALHGLAVTVVLLLVHGAWITQNPILVFARNWYQCLFIPLGFRELHYLIHPIHPVDIDPILVEIDRSLLGVHPTVWLERWTFPLLTEYLQIVYSTFYFLPLALGAILWRKRKYREFQETMLAVVTTFYLSYLGYIAFPALGPRFEIAHLQNVPLQGLWISEWLRDTLNELERIQRDAFPSGHTGVTLVLLLYAFRYARRTFPFFGVIIGSLIFSTVYLRYHYVVDVIAGFALAVLSIGVAVPLNRWWRSKRGDPFVPV